jgi:membrane-associated phospholipid phosphatase
MKLLISLLLIFPFMGMSQPTDSLLVARSHFHTSFNHYFSPARIAIPAGLIAYGFISLDNPELESLNKSTRSEILEHNTHFRTSVDNYLQFAPAASVYLLDAAGVKARHNFRDRTILLLTSTALTAGSVFMLKKITGQWRPDASAANSFPSGHTATAFSGAEFMRQEYKDQYPLLSYSGYAMAAGTGTLRMLNNRHWLADVIAGAGLGMLSTKASYWLFDKMSHKKPHLAHL